MYTTVTESNLHTINVSFIKLSRIYDECFFIILACKFVETNNTWWAGKIFNLSFLSITDRKVTSRMFVSANAHSKITIIKNDFKQIMMEANIITTFVKFWSGKSQCNYCFWRLSFKPFNCNLFEQFFSKASKKDTYSLSKRKKSIKVFVWWSSS